LVVSQQSRRSQESEEEVDTEVRICIRWRRIGESKGRSAGGGRGETKAVGRQARSGGRRVRGSGGLMSSTMVGGGVGVIRNEECLRGVSRRERKKD
jgi:hypothetical protein